MKPLVLTDSSRNNPISIVISDKASAHERIAASELEFYLCKLAGAEYGTVGTKISIVSDREKHAGTLILLGRNRYTEKFALATSGLGSEGYRIKRVDNALILIGTDDVGVRFAVYHFLEKVCGIRWFWPGESGEDIPKNSRISIGELDLSETPDFQMRQFIGPSGLRQDATWSMRNRLGGSVALCGSHSFGKMVPPAVYGEKHPEYFALVDGERTFENFNGKHRCQLCTTNPDTIALCVKYVRDFFDAHPEGIFNISPNDGGGFCECPQCAALDKGKTCLVHHQEIPCVSGQIFTFANKIGEAISRSHPDRFVAIMAYHQYLAPPPIENFRLHPNVILQLCLNCDMNHHPEQLATSNAIIEDWANIAGKKAIYEYLVWRGNAELPRTLHSVIPDALRRYHACGARLYSSQAYNDFCSSGLNYYLTAKLLWNVNADVHAILDDYFQRCFGSAERIMRRYYELLDERWRHALQILGCDYYSGSPAYYLEMFTPEVLEEMESLLEKAAESADSYKISSRIEPFRKNHKYTVLTMKAIQSLRNLEKTGIIYLNKAWPTHIETHIGKQQSTFTAEWEEIGSDESVSAIASTPISNYAKTYELIQHALKAWDLRNAYVEYLKDSSIIDYWHIRHDVDRDYHFDPSCKLREIKAACENEMKKNKVCPSHPDSSPS